MLVTNSHNIVTNSRDVCTRTPVSRHKKVPRHLNCKFHDFSYDFDVFHNRGHPAPLYRTVPAARACAEQDCFLRRVSSPGKTKRFEHKAASSPYALNRVARRSHSLCCGGVSQGVSQGVSRERAARARLAKSSRELELGARGGSERTFPFSAAQAQSSKPIRARREARGESQPHLTAGGAAIAAAAAVNAPGWEGA